jgi:hypothetical protein
MVQKLFKFSFIFLMILLITGCGTTPIKQGIYLTPDYQSSSISEIVVLPPVDLRVDKKVDVNLEKQIRGAAVDNLKNKNYKVTKSDNLGSASQIIEEDLKTASPDWIKVLGPSDSRYIMVVCLVDVSTRLTFGSTGNAEIAGYMYDKGNGTVIWRDKGVGQVGQGGLIGMVMKSGMDESAISAALYNTLASIPPKSK